MTPEFRKFCESRFQAAVQAEFGRTLPWFFSNLSVQDTLDQYVVMHVLASEDSRPIRLGREVKERNVGVIQIDFYTPKDTGSRDGAAMAWKLAKHFRQIELSVYEEGNVVFRSPSVRDKGEVRNRHKEQVDVPYRYDFLPEFVKS